MQTEDKEVDDSWMYHEPAPDPWLQLLDKMDNERMNDTKKEIVPLNADCWPNGKKLETWQADYMGKLVVPPSQKEQWYNVYVNEKTIPNGTRLQKIKLKVMSDSDVEQYCGDYAVVEEGKESWRNKYPDSNIPTGPRTVAEKGDDIPF